MNKYSYEEWLHIITNNLDSAKANPKFGLSKTLFAINHENQIVGIVNFRYTITNFYKDSEHVGYSVRPSERKKGYATEILRQIIEMVKKEGLKQMILVSKKDNLASIKTIINNHGVLVREFTKEEIYFQEFLVSLRENEPVLYDKDQ